MPQAHKPRPPIMLDLTKDLTVRRINRAALNSGVCQYEAPCIIGSMFSPAQRTRLDNPRWRDSHLAEASEQRGDCILFTTDIKQLIKHGMVVFPTKKQEADAARLQLMFDNEDVHSNEYQAICAKYTGAKA